jgi:hypothetical protein
MTEDGKFFVLFVEVNASSPERDPVWKSKVDSLSKIEAVVKTGMIRPRKGDDNVTGALVKTPHGYPMFKKNGWGESCSEMKEEVRI